MEKTFQTTHTGTIPELQPGTKILFANMPADGHFNPLTGLAVYLQQQGCDVRWYTSATYADKIKKLQIPFYPFIKAMDVPADKIEEIFPERKQYKNIIAKLNFDIINYFILRSTEYYADISDIHKTFPFDVVIADICFSAIPLVKEKLNVPVVAIGVLPLPETSKDLPPSGLGMTPSHNWPGRLKQAALRLLADKVLFRKSNQVMRRIMEQNGIDTGGYNVFDLLVKKSTLVLQSGTPGFEYQRSDMGSNIRFIGPLLPYSTKKQRTWTHPKLQQYEKVIIVTQGTVERDPEKIIVPALEAFKNSGCLVIATTGGSRTKELQERFPQENFIIEDFIPFADIMPHAQVYITNGGYGGVMLGIQYRLPMVVAGVHEGKNEINARIGYFKLGINLKTEKPTPFQVKSSVEKIFADDSYRRHVEQLGREFSYYNPQVLCASYVAEVLQPQAASMKQKLSPVLTVN